MKGEETSCESIPLSGSIDRALPPVSRAQPACRNIGFASSPGLIKMDIGQLSAMFRNGGGGSGVWTRHWWGAYNGSLGC